MNQIAQKLKTRRNLVKYHVDKLKNNGVIKSVSQGNELRLYTDMSVINGKDSYDQNN